MMHRFSIFFVIVLCCSAAFGKSIFDDDFVPPSDSPAAKPQPPATPPRPQDLPEPTPKAIPAPVVPPDPTIVIPPDGSATVSPPAKFPTQKEDENSAVDVALAGAREALKRAETAANEKLEKENEYVSARQRARADALSGKTNSPAALQMQHLHDAILLKDVAYADAKRYVTYLSRFKSKPQDQKSARPVAPKSDAEFKQEIADAIAAHSLAEGMTFQESCKSARKPFELISQSEGTKVYHWDIKGQNGTEKIATRGPRGRVKYDSQPTYGVIGYVEATFDDDYLTEYSRVSTLGKNKSK